MIRALSETSREEKLIQKYNKGNKTWQSLDAFMKRPHPTKWVVDWTGGFVGMMLSIQYYFILLVAQLFYRFLDSLINCWAPAGETRAKSK